MIEIIKEFYVFALLLLVFSYLVPKDGYKAYIQFFIGIFLLVVILKPVLQLVVSEDLSGVYEIFEEYNTQVEQRSKNNQWEVETEGGIYELFIFEGEGE
jgi:stage III sporulation protein AF